MYKTKNHSKFSLKAHLVFVVKYRKKLINTEISFFLKQIFLQIAEKSNLKIELIETDKNHIHLLIDYEPNISITQIVRKLKQESTYSLWKTHYAILKKHFWKEQTFWSNGYFACIIGDGASYSTIQKYIKNQG